MSILSSAATAFYNWLLSRTQAVNLSTGEIPIVQDGVTKRANVSLFATQAELDAAVIDAAASATPAAFALNDEFTSRYFPIQFNITHFGAVGDDATNNLVAIRAAMTAASVAGGGIVIIPEGIFRCGVAGTGGAMFDIPSNVQVIGINRERSIIKSMSTAAHVVFRFNTAVDSSSLRHVGITANANASSSQATNMNGATNCVVEDCQISDGFGWGCFMQGDARNCGIVDSVILGTVNAHGVEINGSSFCFAERNRIDNTGDTPGVSNGIELYDQSTTRVIGCRIIGNFINGGVGFGILASGIEACTIANNIINGPGSGGIALTLSAFASRVSKGNTVSGNTIRAANTGGVGPSGAIDIGAGAVENTITGNAVIGTLGTAAAIFVSGVDNAIVANVCSLNGGHGIFLNTPATGTVVAGNTCNDNGVTTSNTYDGIQSSADFCTFIANTCSDTRGGSARQRFGVFIGGANCAIIGNRGSGNLDPIGTVNDIGTDNTVLGNDAVLRLSKFVGYVGFYGTAPIAKQTGVAVTAAGVHAALVNLGLIS